MSESNHKSLSPEDLAILGALQNTHSPSQIEKFLEDTHPMSRPTLVRRINQLMGDGYVKGEGLGRARAYHLTDQGKQQIWFLVPSKDRPKVFFDRQRLDSYIPNSTRWLSEEQCGLLEQAQPIHGAPANTYVRQIAEKLMIDLSHASSALEGNTYSWAETKHLLETGVAAEGKTEEETAMVINHQKAIQYVLSLIDTKEEGLLPSFDGNIDLKVIRNIHHQLSKGLLREDQRGDIRKILVEIGASAYVPESSPQVLEECLTLICHKANQIENPFERSFFLLVAIPYLQPFADINKRTGRLCSNIPLLMKGLAPLSFQTMDRNTYIQGLLHFYELGDVRLIAKAYVNAYISSAKDYTIALGRTKEEIKFFAKHHRLLDEAVNSLGKAWSQDRFLSIDEVVPENFSEEEKLIFKNIMTETISFITQEKAELDGYDVEAIPGLLAMKEHWMTQKSSRKPKR